MVTSRTEQQSRGGRSDVPSGLLDAPARERSTTAQKPGTLARRGYEPFSLLLSVHEGVEPDFLRQAFRSAVHDQVLRPNEVVLVRDGPVSAQLASCLEGLIAESPAPVSLVALERNRGLGPALDAGLAVSQYDIVARMDADDVAMPHRFSVQIPLISAGADIVGSGLVEFGRDVDDVLGRRTPPTDPAEIVRYARMHDPFNHPTVVYRREAVRAAGGYGDLPLMEDYWLFARMLANGAKALNVAEPLVYYRVGAGAYKRRGGRALLRSELRLQHRFYAEGFTTRSQYLRNVAVRGGYRLCPTWFRRMVYRRIVANYGQRRGKGGTGAASTAVPEVTVSSAAQPPTH